MPKINKYQEILKEIENFDEIFMELPTNLKGRGITPAQNSTIQRFRFFLEKIFVT